MHERKQTDCSCGHGHRLDAIEKGAPGQSNTWLLQVVDGVLTMTDKDGQPAEDATGKRYTHRLAANEDERAVACKMTKELREARNHFWP